MSAVLPQNAEPVPWWHNDSQGTSAAHWYGHEACNMVSRLQELATTDASEEVRRNARQELSRILEYTISIVMHLKHEE